MKLALDSALAQVRRADEIVVVDDASTDGTQQVLRSYDPATVQSYLLEHRVPAPEAWNAAVRRTKSEYVVALAHDDLLDADFLKEANRAIVDENPDLFITGNEVIDHSGWRKSENRMPPEFDPPGIIPAGRFLNSFTKSGQFVLPSATVFRRALFDRIGGFGLAYQGSLRLGFLFASRARVAHIRL